MEVDYASMKDKLEATKARNKVLANENKIHKDQIKTLLDKGKHDDELIDALMVNIIKYLSKEDQIN